MLLEFVSGKLFVLFKIILSFFLIGILLQILLKWLIFLLVRFTNISLDYFSYGYILGLSIRRVRLSSESFKLYIGRISLSLGWTPTIILHDVDLTLLQNNKIPIKNSSHRNNGWDLIKLFTQKKSDNKDYINERKIVLQLSSRKLNLIKRIFRINILFRRVNINVHDTTKINIHMVSLTFVNEGSKNVGLDTFFYSITDLKNGGSINHVGLNIKCQIEREDKVLQKHDHSNTTLLLSNWNCSFKLGDTSLYIPLDGFRNTSNEKLAKNRDIGSGNVTDKNSLLSYDKFSNFIRSFDFLLKTLHFIDIKIENVDLHYGHKFTINISSIQLYLEAINILNDAVSRSILPSEYSPWGEYEISISTNALAIKTDDISILHVPLINLIFTTNILLHFIEKISLSKTVFSSHINIINPSLFATLEQVILFIEFYKYATKKNSSPSKDNLTNQSHNQIERSFIESVISAESWPTLSLELNISNFKSILQLSKSKNLSFNVFDIQGLYGLSNKQFYKNRKHIPIYKNDPSFSSSPQSLQKLTNCIKIIGAELYYMDLSSSEKSLIIPICGFERIDTYIHELDTKKLNVESTLRHLYISLNNLTVLDTVSEMVGKLHKVLLQKQSEAPRSANQKTKNLFVDTLLRSFQWNIRVRFKDIAFSMILAKYLPRQLDFLELDGFNLADVHRGAKLVFQEILLNVNGNGKRLLVNDATLYRIMDDEDHESVTDSIISLSDLDISIDNKNEIYCKLPTMLINFDVNIIWLTCYMFNIISNHLPKKKASQEVSKNMGIKNILQRISVRIGEIIMDIKLPQETPLLLIINTLEYSGADTLLCIGLLSIQVESVYFKDTLVYVSLLEIDQITVDISKVIDNKSLVLKSNAINIHTEYHFKIYLITDNIVTLYKSFKQIRCAFADTSKYIRVLPKEQKPVALPDIQLLSERFLIEIEEDPFEQELGLIFKVGVLAQRERLHKLEEFDRQIQMRNSPGNLSQDSVLSTINEGIDNVGNAVFEETTYNKLMEHFSTSWITRFKKAKYVFQGMPGKVQVHEQLGLKYLSYSKEQTPTVANLIIENMHLRFGIPSFPINSYNDFLYEYGKGIPKDTIYTLLILMGISFKTDLWELRLRDYPLPILSFPNTSTEGDVAFAEQMPDDMALYTVFVPFVKSASRDKYTEISTIYGSHLIRTMNSIKTFANCRTTIGAEKPVCITWGKSLQPGFESLMLWFDYFTKPKMDPSPKLGFWDKFRFLFHGRWVYQFLGDTGLHLNIKGAYDPYEIADSGAGLTFCWSGDTVMDIYGSSDPKEFLKINSKRFELGIRDFTVINRFDKILMKLNGNVLWKMGLLFEKGDFKNAGETPRELPVRPHHTIRLVNPKTVSKVKDYDSYTGFRSSFIHMSFGVYSSQVGSSNSIYLAPQSVSHFLRWWKLFNTYTSGPIRQGPLFTDALQNKTKFGRSLFTIKYQLKLEPLTVSYVYQHILTKYVTKHESRKEFTGIKGRFSSLKIDLHQRKLKLTHKNAKLNKTKPVWKFRMSSGEIDCIEPDMRVLSTIFDNSLIEKILSPLSKNNDYTFTDKTDVNIDELRESEWYDYDDYIDLNQMLFTTAIPIKLEAIPLLYSPRISYFRNLNEKGIRVNYPFGNENSHSCFIGRNQPEKTQEKLAYERKLEIETEIKDIEFKIDNLTYSNEIIEKVDQKVLNNLYDRIEELKKRLHIIHNVLNDLKLLETMHDNYYGENSDESNLSSLSELSSDSHDTSLLRASTIESFLSMRKTSSIDMESKYDNRFIVHNIQLILDKRLRDLLLEYASTIEERKAIRYAMTYKSVKIFKELLGTVLRKTKTFFSAKSCNYEDDLLPSNMEFIKQFDEIIKEVPDENFDAIDNYLFRLISPQIQLRSQKQTDAAVILSARDIEIGIIDVLQVIGKDGKKLSMDVDTIVETRYCSIAKDIQLFTLFKDDFISQQHLSYHKVGYGMEKWSNFWPPWIPLEMCFDGTLMENYMFLKRRSMFLTFTIPNPLYFDNLDITGFSTDSKCRIGFPGLLLTSTSRQYNTFYSIVEELLKFDSNNEEKVQKLTKTLLADEIRNNLDKLDVSVISKAQDRIRELFYTRSFLKVNNPSDYAKNSQQLLQEIETSLLQLTVLMKAIKQNHDRLENVGDSVRQMKWLVETDELIWELYDDVNSPFVTIGLGPSAYIRTETTQGLVTSRISITSLQCFNLQKNAIFIELLAPFKDNPLYKENEAMVNVKWIQTPPVAGISNLEELVISLQPFVFKMDKKTGDKLMNYLFPKNVDSSKVDYTNSQFGLKPSCEYNTMYFPRDDVHKSLSMDDSDGASIKESKYIDSWDLSSYTGGSLSSKESRQQVLRQKLEVTNAFLQQNDQIFNQMLERAGLYFNIKSVVIERTVIMVSYKGSRRMLTDVKNLTVKVPELHYCDKLWSRDEFFAALKHDIVKIVVHHLGSIIGNKFIPHKKENKSKIQTEISQILDSPNSRYETRSVSLLESVASTTHSGLGVKSTHSVLSQDDNIQPFFPE